MINYDQYQGDNPLSFVISKNLHRRHLDASQRAMIATDVKPLLEVEARKRQLANLKQYADTVVEIMPQREAGKSRDKAGDLFGVSGRYVATAEKIKREDPELADKVRSGQISIPDAQKKMQTCQRFLCRLYGSRAIVGRLTCLS